VKTGTDRLNVLDSQPVTFEPDAVAFGSAGLIFVAVLSAVTTNQPAKVEMTQLPKSAFLFHEVLCGLYYWLDHFDLCWLV
jgi:hypothetical protein